MSKALALARVLQLLRGERLTWSTWVALGALDPINDEEVVGQPFDVRCTLEQAKDFLERDRQE